MQASIAYRCGCTTKTNTTAPVSGVVQRLHFVRTWLRRRSSESKDKKTIKHEISAENWKQLVSRAQFHWSKYDGAAQCRWTPVRLHKRANSRWQLNCFVCQPTHSLRSLALRPEPWMRLWLFTFVAPSLLPHSIPAHCWLIDVQIVLHIGPKQPLNYTTNNK